VVRAELESARGEGAISLSPEQIAKAEELANWDFIKASKNSQEFRDHLARFPKGVTEQMARTKLEALVWAGLPSPPASPMRVLMRAPWPRPDARALRNFIEEFPKGVHAAEATSKLAELERQAAAAREAEERAEAARKAKEERKRAKSEAEARR